MTKVTELDVAIKEVCPIHGVARLRDGTVRIDFKDEATKAQQKAAQAIADGFDWDTPSVDLRKDAEERIKAKWDQLSQEQKDLALLSGVVKP